MKTYHGKKKSLSSITNLKLITKQEVDKKTQLERKKAELITILASKIK